MAVTTLGFMRINRRLVQKIEAGFLCPVLLFLLLLSSSCSMSGKEERLASEEELRKQRQRELSEPLGMSSRLYLDSQ